MREWAADLRAQGFPPPNTEDCDRRTVVSLKQQATFFREIAREIVDVAPEMGSLLLEVRIDSAICLTP